MVGQFSGSEKMCLSACYFRIFEVILAMFCFETIVLSPVPSPPKFSSRWTFLEFDFLCLDLFRVLQSCPDAWLTLPLIFGEELAHADGESPNDWGTLSGSKCQKFCQNGIYLLENLRSNKIRDRAIVPRWKVPTLTPKIRIC